MVLLRGAVAIVITIIITLILYEYKSLVILYVPKFKKQYVYEDLDDQYKSYLIIYYLIAWIIYLIIFLITINFFEFISLKIALKNYVLLTVKKEYWIFPSLIFSFHFSNILSRRLFKAVLEDNYEELMIYMFCRQNCFSLREMVMKIYYNSKFYKVYYKFITLILGAYITLGLVYYAEINEKYMSINKYVSLKEKTYSYSEVSYIFERYTWKEHSFIIIFNDGVYWNSGEFLYNKDSEEDYKLMKFIEEKSSVKAIELK